MALLRPNPSGIRSYVPQAIRDYFSLETKWDNLFFGQRELDENLTNIYKGIKEATASSDSDNIVIDNVLLHSDAYMYALRTMFREANSKIRIFTRRLSQRMLDGTPLYTDPEIIDAVTQFLSRKDSSFEIIFREKPEISSLEGHTLIGELREFDNLHTYYSANRVVKECHCRFIVVDDRIYNLRYRNYAIINFNNSGYAKRLITIFDRIRNLDSTLRVGFGGMDVKLDQRHTI